MKKRVVVTGLGVISPAGCNKSDLWKNVLSGTSCITKSNIEHPEHEKFPSKVAGIVSEKEMTNLIKKYGMAESYLKTMTRSTRMAILATEEAINDAKLENISEQLKEQTGVAVGSGLPDFSDILESGRMLEKSYNRLSPYFIPKILQNMASGQISMRYGFQGPNHCASTACATGAHAIGDSFKIIQNGMATIMVSGGTDACLNPLTVAGFCRLRALSTNFNDTPEKASRPFDEKRDGFVIAEGAAVLILEELEHALSRNATIYAEILGYGLSGDASNLTTPHQDGKGAVLAMQQAIKDAEGVTKNDITYVNAHATSTPIGDQIELSAIGSLLQGNGKIIVSSMKGCHGHLLGAAGCIETLSTVLACYHAVIPPTANLEQCCSNNPSLKCITEKQEWKDVSRRIALKNAFGFGGTNASLCISNF
ncbi:3-oxoacyl-[acyl-carrier-protein] synthase, mitochondrial [Planococcus citri]|uniref:3-oxoacyl-[acyl-carrier-protein] synthase, mitochondrial n=1 Tax=Planococcus citri TaxID=170843 RepID=UPI0031F98CAE